ncbi:MAG: hypothetical protein AAF915_08770 [Cyanobacteria bacterium P01_D01_bin.50]
MVWLIKASQKNSVNVQLQGCKGMSKSAIINKSSDPSLNVNLGCNLKYKPGDYREELFATVEVLRGRSRRLRRMKEIAMSKSCISQRGLNKSARVVNRDYFELRHLS